MEIKVCGMRERVNCQQLAITVVPDWMGLIFYPKSPRFVQEEESDWIKSLPLKKVGVVVDEQPDLNYNVQPEPYESKKLKPVYDMLRQNMPEYDHKALVETEKQLVPLMFREK